MLLLSLEILGLLVKTAISQPRKIHRVCIFDSGTIQWASHSSCFSWSSRCLGNALPVFCACSIHASEQVHTVLCVRERANSTRIIRCSSAMVHRIGVHSTQHGWRGLTW